MDTPHYTNGQCCCLGLKPREPKARAGRERASTQERKDDEIEAVKNEKLLDLLTGLVDSM